MAIVDEAPNVAARLQEQAYARHGRISVATYQLVQHYRSRDPYVERSPAPRMSCARRGCCSLKTSSVMLKRRGGGADVRRPKINDRAIHIITTLIPCG